MIDIQDRYFREFDLERFNLDKYFFVIYDKKYCMLEHEYDVRVTRDYFNNISKSRAKGKGRFVDVLRKETKNSYYELHLSGSRHIFCYVNIIKFVQDKYCVFPEADTILHNDNFLPRDSKITLKQFIEAKNEIEKEFKILYGKLVKSIWGYDCEEIEISPNQLEVNIELFPCSVNDISTYFKVNDVQFTRYNSQSGTIYFSKIDDMKFSKVRLPDGLIMNVDDSFLGSSVYASGLNSGYSSDKVQIHIYQKSFGLVRVEFTILKEAIKNLITDQDYINHIHFILNDNLAFKEYVKRFDVSLESIIKNVACAVGLSEELVYCLRDTDIWESNRKTDNLRRKLIKKRLLEPITDSIGTKKRGKYRISAWFQEIFKTFKPVGTELFLPELLEKRR